MGSENLHFLFVTIHPLESKHENWNLEFRQALKERAVKTTALSILVESEQLTPEWIANSYTHVCFLLLGDYPAHHVSFTNFLRTSLAEAVKLNPKLRVLNSLAITAWNTDKKYLRELGDAGFPVPQTTILNSRQPLEYLKIAIFAQSSHGNSVVVKPSISASGARTHLIRKPQELSAEDDVFLAGLVSVAARGGVKGSLDVSAGAQSPQANVHGISAQAVHEDCEEQEEGSFGSIMLQEYLPDISKGEYSLCFIGGRLRYTVLKKPKEGGWQVGRAYGGNYHPVRDEDVPAQAKATAVRLLDWLEHRFGAAVEYARVDGVIRGDGSYVLMGE